jgi:DnaJ-like protein
MTIITVKDQFDGTYTVRLRGGDDFDSIIESLKAIIPAFARSYDPDLRCWKIFEKHYLKEWLEALDYFSDVKVEWASTKRQYQAPPRKAWVDPKAEAFKALHLLPSAPPELVKAAYKTLALLHHPDRVGDHSKMIEVNTAYDTLLEAFSW